MRELARRAGLPGSGEIYVMDASRRTSTLAAGLSRRFELQADRAALELTGAPEAFIDLERRLVRRAKADLLLPRLLHRWGGSHPLPEERIEAAEAFAAARVDRAEQGPHR